MKFIGLFRCNIPIVASKQMVRAMKVIIVIMTAFLMQVSASTTAQVLTLKDDNISLKQVFTQIRKQTGYTVLCEAELINKAKPIRVNLEKTPLPEALKKILAGQNLDYVIENSEITITRKEAPSFLERVVDAFTPPVDVRGVVVDEKGMPLPGANVKVKGFKQAAVTDNEGKFYLPGVDDQAVLIVSFVGYKDVEVGVKASLSVALELKAAELNEVVVAYGRTTQQALTGSVTVVKGEQIQSLPNRSFDKSLQGLVPGLLVTSGNGQPGSGPGNFVLRGIATGGQPNNGESFRNPLIVIDGIPVSQEPPSAMLSNSPLTPRVTNPLAQLNPSDIETISVLKDAAAIALYGSKASNGVILVTTKKGKAGKTTFNFRHQTDLASALDGKIKMLNQQEYLDLLFEAYHNSNPTTTEAKIYSDLRKKFPVIVNALGDTTFYPQSDWVGALLNKNAVTIANEISVSGGNDNSNFYLNFEYTKENGVAKKTGYDRKSMRFNYVNRPSSWLKLALNSTFSYNTQDYTLGNTFLTTIGISPLNPIRNNKGDYFYKYLWGQGTTGNFPIPNPIAQGELNINKSSAYMGMSTLNAEVKLFKGLSFNSSLGVNFMLNEARQKDHPLVAIDGLGSVAEQLFRTSGLINTNLLQFNKIWNNSHSLNVLLGQEARIDLNRYSFIQKTNISDAPDQDQLIGGKVISFATGNTSKQTQASYFGQLNYGFEEKYYLSSSIRTDGSSQFGRNNRFGTYWSVGVGWVASNESFLKREGNWLNYLKLRGSMGPAGNSAAIADVLRFDRLSLTNFMDGIAVFPLGGSNPGNPSIQWEETFTWDAGFEVRLLKDRVSITADVYNRKTKNLIAYNIDAPFATGYSKFTGNIGDVKNHGVELSLSANLLKLKNFQWSINANWSRNKNKLTKSFIPRSNFIISGVTNTNMVNEVGYEYNSYYLRKWAGVNPDNGRPMWIDSLGKANENYNAAKPSIVGKAQPDGFGSLNNTFNYKGFGLSVSLYYQYGSQIYLNSNLQNDGNLNGRDPYFNQTKDALNRWQKPGDITKNPRRLLNGRASTGTGSQLDQGTLASTRYLYDGDFVRLANIQFNYALPRQLTKRLHLNVVNLFLQGHNLATWTKYSGDDPENVGPSGFGNILYPQSRSYSIGLNVNF